MTHIPNDLTLTPATEVRQGYRGVDAIMPDKGKVEGLAKYARANFMTPIPQAARFDDLNAMLADRCRQRQGEIAGRHSETIGKRLVTDRARASCDCVDPAGDSLD